MATDKQLYEHMNSSRKQKLHNFHSDTEYTVKIMSLCLMKHHTLKTYGGVEISLHVFSHYMEMDGQLPTLVA
jgi:hypothetical protein